MSNPTFAEITRDDMASFKKKYEALHPKKIQKAEQNKNVQLVSSSHQFQAHAGTNHGYGYNSKQSGGKTAFGLTSYIDPISLDHYAIRENARSASVKSPQARTILQRFNDSVIGNGLRLDPTPDFETLGITREEAEAWSKDFRNRFDLWASSKDSDLTGTNTFYQNQRFYGWQYERDGDVFPRYSYSDDPNLLNPLQISFVDANQIRGDEFTFSSGPETQDTGIIKDKNGKTTAFKIWINDPLNQGRYKDITVPAFDKKTGRPLMSHGFTSEWAGQERGISSIGYSLQEFQDILSFETATIKKAINGASKDYIVENDIQDPSDLGLSQLDDSRAVLPTETNPTATPLAAPQNLGVEGVVVRTMLEQTSTEANTSILGASQGDRLKAVDSLSPSENTGEFVDHKFRYLAASMSMPASIATMKFDKSHSASRGEMGQFQDVREIKKDDIAADFLNIAVFAWASEEIAAGRIKAPGFSDPRLRAAWLKNNWIAKPLPDVDPLKTMQAKEKAIRLGLSDFDKEAMLYNGSSGKANRTKVNEQLGEMESDPFELAEAETTEDNNNQEEE